MASNQSKKKSSGPLLRKKQQKTVHPKEGLLTDKSDFFITEAYKTLRTNLVFSLAGKEGSKVLLVTSAMQSEGKSTSASNIGISFALDGKKVLLVDCDLRRPKLNRLFGLSCQYGLSDVLVDPIHLSDAIIHSDTQNLDVIICGTIPPNPSELLNSDNMRQVLDKMKKEYDLIILDTPPLTMVTDALVLSPNADGVLLVVRAGNTESNAIGFAIDQLNRAQARVLGFLLNGSEFRQTSYGYSRRSYSKYGYYGGYRRYGYGYGSGYSYGYGYTSNIANSNAEAAATEQNEK